MSTSRRNVLLVEAAIFASLALAVAGCQEPHSMLTLMPAAIGAGDAHVEAGAMLERQGDHFGEQFSEGQRALAMQPRVVEADAPTF